jgi:uncharacterized protein (DUF2236 family)
MTSTPLGIARAIATAGINPTRGLLRPLRAAAVSGVQGTIGRPSDAELDRYRAPLGDPGLFGPDSLVWRLHGDLPVMLIGGFSALMLQTLHPLAMAGVSEHSRYREDPLGRLQRTAEYVAGTSFGGMPLVETLVRRVKAVHTTVRGTAPDGRPYSADDADLTTWVHTTEMWSILRSYQRYSLNPLLAEEKDRYLDEVAVLGELLGGREIPRSVAEVRAYFTRVKPELAATEEALGALAFLRTPFGTSLREAAAHRVISEAAVELLPAFAKRLFGTRVHNPILTGVLPGGGPLATRATALGAAALIRWASGPSLARAAASERVSTSRAA